jgi:tRNA(Ile2)-agmatinylcytidine synthase
MKKTLFVGFDDTDSLQGSCTTHLATIIINDLFHQVDFLDFPHLVRLNPNIPYKTRGNGAVALQMKGNTQDLEECKEYILQKVQELSEVDDINTNPGVAFIEKAIPRQVKKLAKRAMWDFIPLQEGEQLSRLSNVSLFKYKKGLGIIGALSAIGNKLEGDFTYEHLSYRLPENFGTERRINEESVLIADKATPLTFSNVDYEYDSVMITPRGADPVFAGIRGETVQAVRQAWALIEPLEEIAMEMIFRTNQHTNAHFPKRFQIQELKPYLSVFVDAIVSKRPFYIEGGHLIFRIKDRTGAIDCAAYEPTKRFRGEINDLVIGDKVRVYGGIRPAGENHPMTINIERLDVLKLTAIFQKENPFCDKCSARLKSAGKNKGYKCPKCSTVYRKKKPFYRELERTMKEQKYLPPIVAHRHLIRPVARANRNNRNDQLPREAIHKILQELVKQTQQTKFFKNNV